MRILAIESALMGGSVAVLDSDVVLGEVVLEAQRRTAQTLLPAVHQLLAEARWQPGDVELVAVTVGPGSFTGLRIGVTAAKTFAYAIGAPVLGISTLEVLAAQVVAQGGVEDPSRPLWVVMEAEREQLFAARFRHAGGAWQADVPEQIVDKGLWLEQLGPGMRVTGPAVNEMRNRLPPTVELTAADVWLPRAATVGRLASGRYAAGERTDLWSLVPTYLRPSAAEEKRNHAVGAGGIAPS
jgi:tRNA threonylcarbamoyladenosine biosynthesis protein TsaB